MLLGGPLRFTAALLVIGTAFAVAVASSAELVALYFAGHASAAAGSEALASAAWTSPLNWQYPYRRATVLAAVGRHREARAAFEKALVLNPACATCSVAIADLAARAGEDPSPWLDRARAHGRSSTRVRMEAGILSARLGRDDAAAADFRAALLGHRRRPEALFETFHSAYDDAFVLERIVPDELLERYLAFARRRLALDSVRAVWARSYAVGVGDRARAVYAEYLLGHGLVDEAWRARFGPSAATTGGILNGGFERGEDLAPFGWRIGSAEGVDAGIHHCKDCRQGGRALRLRFDGEHNPGYFRTVQLVPVEPGGRYALDAHVRADRLTSASGPLLMVVGANGGDGSPITDCKLRAASEAFLATSDWRPVTIEFEVPIACRGVRVLVARPATERLNQLIGGELWVDDVRLEKLPGAERASGSTAGT